NVLGSHGNRYRQRRISSKVHGLGVLNIEHQRFKRSGSTEEWNPGWQLLKRWNSNEINLFENLTERMLPFGFGQYSGPIVVLVFQLTQQNTRLGRARDSLL